MRQDHTTAPVSLWAGSASGSGSGSMPTTIPMRKKTLIALCAINKQSSHFAHNCFFFAIDVPQPDQQMPFCLSSSLLPLTPIVPVPLHYHRHYPPLPLDFVCHTAIRKRICFHVVIPLPHIFDPITSPLFSHTTYTSPAHK